MSILPALGSRQSPSTALNNAARQAGDRGASNGADALMKRTGQDAVSLSRNAIDLSAQGMAERNDALGNATLDVAQNFLANFAQSLLGDAAKGASVSFDSASLRTASGFAGLVGHSQGPNGSADIAAFSLSESAHFIGKGKITTEDGQTFEFEIEVQYESRIEAAALSRSGAAADQLGDGNDNIGGKDGGDARDLPKVKLPDINFPGSLGDLFKLIGQQLQTDLPDPAAKNGDKAGTLTLRMLNLVNHATLLDAADAARDDAKSRAKAVADAYGVPAPATAPTPAAPLATGAADGDKPSP